MSGGSFTGIGDQLHFEQGIVHIFHANRLYHIDIFSTNGILNPTVRTLEPL